MIEKFVRKEVIKAKCYPEEMLPCTLKMDANENEWGLPLDIRALIAKDMTDYPFHRYPDSDSTMLRERLSAYTGVPAENLMVGNGSDELIHYVVSTFVGATDRVVIPAPAFSMYSFFVNLAGGVVIDVKPDESFRIDAEKVVEAAAAENANVVFICNPNNPTGSVLSLKEIKMVIEKSQAIVLVDEAYYEFYGQTVIDWIDRYPNLIVIRTLSKAVALAGLRIGFLAAGGCIMKYLSRVKVPYNVNSFSQYAACRVLENRESLDGWIDTFKMVRDDFINSLRHIEGVTVFPSQGNFVLLKMKHAQIVWDRLMEKGILTREFGGGLLEDCIRVTVCPPQQNQTFAAELKKCIGEAYP